MISRFRALAALVLAVSAVFALSACSPQAVEVTPETVVIDVRTPEEFTSGHLDGALNLNWEGEFAADIADLPKDGHYLLYCRSGNRAGQAEAFMKAEGFEHVVNLGSVAEASSATGIPVVTD